MRLVIASKLYNISINSNVTYDATTIVSDVSIQHNVQPLDVELIFEEVFDTGFYSFSICPVTSLILVSSTIQMHILELISVLPIEEMEDNSHRDSVMIYTHQPEEHPLPRANRSGKLKKVVFHFPYIAYSTRKEPEETRVFAINIHAKAEWNQVTHPPFATNLQNHPLFSYQFGLWQSLPQRPVCVSRQKFSTFSNTQSQSPKTLSFVFNHKTGEMITPTDPGPSMDGVSSSALSRKFIQITSSQQKRNVTNELDAFHSVAPTPGIVCDSVVFVACLATSRFSQGSLLSIRLFTLSSLLHQPPLSRHEPPLLLINTPSKSAFFDCFDGSLLSSITHTEPAIAISLSPLLLTVLTEKRRLFVHSLLIETPPSSNPDDSSKLSSCCPAVKFKQEGVRALLANEVGNTSFLSRLIPTNLTTIESPNNFPLHSTTSLYSSESPQFPSSFPLITSSPDVPPPLASPGIGLSTPRQGTPSLSTHGSSPSHITAFSLTPYHAGSFGTPSSFDRERRLSNSETVSEKASDKEMSGQSRLDDTTQSTKMHSHPNLTSSSPRLTQRQLSDRQKDIADKERSLLVSHPPFSSSLIYVSSSAIFHGTRLITTPISLLVLSKTMDSDHIAQQSSFQIQSPLQSQLGYTVLPSKGSRQLASSIPQKPVTATIPLVTASSSQDPDIITSIPLNFAPSARLKQSRVDNEPQAICVGWDIHRFAPESFASVITSLSNQSEVPTPTQLSSLDWDTINTTETTLAMMTAYTSICSFLPSSPTSTEVTIFGYGTSVSPQQRSDWTNRVNECCCHLAKQHLRMLRRLNQSIADGSVKDSSPKFSEQIRSLYTKACSFFIRGHGNPYEVCSLFRQEVTSCAGLQFAENVSAEDEEAVKEANKESCEQTLLQFILSEVFDGCHLSPLPIPSTKELKAFLSTAIKVFRNHSPETLSQFVLSPTLPKAVVLHDHFTSIDQILLRTLIDLRGTTFSSTLPEEEDNAQNRLYFSIFVLVVKQCTLPFKDVLGESLSQDEDKEDPIACLAELKKDALAELMLDFFNKNDGWSQVETVRGKTVFSELIKFVHTHRPFASVAILTPELTKGSLRFDLCLDILVNGLSGSYSYGNTSKRNASLFKLFFHPTVTQMTTSWTLGTVGNGPKFLSPFQIFSQCTDLDKSSRLPETIAEVKSSFDVLLVVALSLFERSILNPSDPLTVFLGQSSPIHDEHKTRSLSFPTFGEFVNSLYFLSSHTLFVSSQQSPSDSGLLPTCPQSTEPCMCKSRPSEMSPNDRMSFLTLLDCSEQPGLSTTLSFGLFVCLLLSCSLPYTAETIMPIIDGVFHRILSQQKETPLNHLVNSCICSLRTAFTLLLLLNQGDYSSLFKTCLETCVPHVYLALSNAVATTSSIWVLSLNTLFASTINLNVRDHISQQLLLAAIRKFPLSQLPFLGKLNEISSVPNNILSTLVFTDVVVDALRQAQQNEQGMRIKSILKTTTFPYQ
ncbi:hypothetical protein BLNAU_7325 [Blattamonas nauphoetae]|uniref:Uncharacterized protein n=1 Tax=Blattamonas nauphoetae TaxID=2049346 RepID=A0ABQ9Y1R8_9EUKA|nr:hypothetical protein BLNAU_7325 [Blattamonas nauphoetae]